MAEQEVKKQGDVYSSYEDALKDSGVEFISEEDALSDGIDTPAETIDFGGERASIEELTANAQEEAQSKAVEEEETETQEESLQESNESRSYKFENKEESQTEETVGSTIADEDVLKAINEKFGREFKSIEDIKQVIAQEQTEEPVDAFSTLPEDLQAAIKFAQETGRSINDWVMYQSLNTSEMDDLNAIRLSYQLEYPDLTNEEREELIVSKYHLDEDEYTEREVRVGKTNLKADSIKAKKEIERLRNQYLVKENKQVQEAASEVEDDSVFDETWMNQMESFMDEIENLEFDDGKGGSFKYGITDEIKNSIKAQNRQVENFFDKYVNNDGSWNHDLFNSHAAVINNIEKIVQDAISYGISKGQKEMLDRTTNASSESPRTGQTQDNGLAKQMQEIAERISGRPQMRIKI